MSSITLTRSEQATLDCIQQQMGEHISPTQIGVSLGHPYASASSRVAPALAKLRDAGLATRHIAGHNKVTYTA